MKKHIKIFTGSALITNRLAHLLDRVDIPTLIKDFKESARLAGFGAVSGSSDLYIYESDFTKAELIIKNFKKEISN